MALDPTKHKDWEIAQDAEKTMLKIYEIGEKLGLTQEELLPQGHYIAKIDFRKVLERLKDKPNGKYIDVTAITPTPLGEGKSTSSMGLVQGLGKLGKKVCAAIRQPSGGPTMNIKGSAAGGGLAQCIPLTPFSLGFTGDINAIMNAHNLAMVALTSRMQHERNYNDEQLERLSGMKRLGIDGVNGKTDGFMMKSKFGIAVSSEVMAILAMATDLKDMRERMGRIVVAYTKTGKAITTEDLQVAGAMTAWMVDALNPSLMQTMEGQPVFVHAGPFANIAIGQSSIVADRIALKLGDYVVTESGFGADIGFEKFWNLKCRFSGNKPNAAVLVATIRALKCHGGAPIPIPGRPLDPCYKEENVGWVEKGTENLVHHINTVKKAGINPVVCINHFYTDTDAEVKAIRRLAEKAGARVALSQHWLKGGDGALELADAVIDACNQPNNFKFLYELTVPLRTRIEMIAEQVYGADGVDFTPEALTKVKALESDPDISKMGTCMVKTHLSITDNPQLKGVPKGWRLHIRDILVFNGAGFVVPMAGDIKLMPGTSSDPAFRRVDVGVKTGKVKGVF